VDREADLGSFAVPFLRRSDGGLVAFWYRGEPPCIVYIGAHGELEVLAPDFDEFRERDFVPEP